MLILGLISSSIISFGIWIAAGIYHVASWAFELFIVLSTGNLLERDTYSQMLSNFYIVLGIIMLFFLSFVLLKAMVNPDDESKSTAIVKKVILNLVTSSVITALLPFIFGFLYDFQNSFIVNQNTIGAFFGFSENSGGSNSNINQVKRGAYLITNSVFTAFFNVTPENCYGDTLAPSDVTQSAIINCQGETKSNSKFLSQGETFNCDYEDDSFLCAMDYVNNFGRFAIYSNFSDEADNGKIEFNFLLSVIAGCVLVYVAISFSIDMAVRLVKLVFYQLIAPIPIFSRVIPDTKLSGSFNQWLKVTITCYLEVYVRIFILYFTIFLCKSMLQPHTFLTEDVWQYGFFIALFAKAFVLLGILLFMKQAPKLISEVTGLDSGNMKLGIKDRLKESGIFNVGAAGVGFVGGMIAGKGNPLAGIRAARSGWKNGNLQGLGEEATRRREYRDAREAGVTRRQIVGDRIRGAFGLQSSADAYAESIDRRKENITNNTGTKIDFTKEDGTVVSSINTGEQIMVDSKYIEDLNAQKTRNISLMSESNEKIRVLDKQINFGSAQIQFKSNLKGEAEKKIDEAGSAVKHTITYQAQDANGNTINKTFEGTYAQIEKFVNEDLDPAQRQIFDLHDIRDKMVESYISGELSANGDNKIKQDMRSGYNTIINAGGYDFNYYDVDSNGNQITKTGRIEVTKDSNGNYIVNETKDGNTSRLNDTMNDFEIISRIDKLAKASNGVLKDQKQYIEEVDIDKYKTQNEAIDNIVKQVNESKDALKQSEAQRRREASKKYTANRKK